MYSKWTIHRQHQHSFPTRRSSDLANRYHGTSHKVPAQADIGYRSNNALIGSGADIVIPRDSPGPVEFEGEDRKSTRLNSSHLVISYAVFCLKRKRTIDTAKAVDIT